MTATTHEWESLGSEIMDSRSLISVADEIRTAIADYEDDGSELALEALECSDGTPEGTLSEARAILASIVEIEEAGLADWEYGETLIREDYFVQYAQELADDIGAVDKDAVWPTSFIDWDAAAEALKQDYTEVTYRGTTYYSR